MLTSMFLLLEEWRFVDTGVCRVTERFVVYIRVLFFFPASSRSLLIQSGRIYEYHTHTIESLTFVCYIKQRLSKKLLEQYIFGF